MESRQGPQGHPTRKHTLVWPDHSSLRSIPVDPLHSNTRSWPLEDRRYFHAAVPERLPSTLSDLYQTLKKMFENRAKKGTKAASMGHLHRNQGPCRCFKQKRIWYHPTGEADKDQLKEGPDAFCTGLQDRLPVTAGLACWGTQPLPSSLSRMQDTKRWLGSRTQP